MFSLAPKKHRIGDRKAMVTAEKMRPMMMFSRNSLVRTFPAAL